jgi:hypothetical protein
VFSAVRQVRFAVKFLTNCGTSYDVAVTIPSFIINCASAHHTIGVGYDIAILVAWGLSVYSCFSQGKLFSTELVMHTEFASTAILVWRLYALYNQSKHLLYVLVSLFLPIVALSIGTNIYVYSLPNALSGGFDLGRIGRKLTSSCLYSDRDSNSECYVLHSQLQHWVYGCNLCFHPYHML